MLSNSNESYLCLKPSSRTNKNLVYKGKKYPIDFCLLKRYSTYFYNKRKEYKNMQDINIKEINLISEEIFQCFVSCIQQENFLLNDSNVLGLHQLSIQYEITELTKETATYIKDNNKNLVFQSIQFKTQFNNLNKPEISDPQTTTGLESDEEIIVSNFFEFINNMQLLDLPIPILYRILHNPKLSLNKLNEHEQNQIFEFLFKCLDKFKKEGSVLFSNLNLDIIHTKIDIINRLIKDYTDIFDFSMIDSNFLIKTTSELLTELSKLKLEYSIQINQMKELIETQKENMNQSQTMFDSFIKIAEKQTQKDEKYLNDFKEQLLQRQENFEESFNELREQFKQKYNEKILNEIREQLSQSQLNYEESFNELRKQLSQSQENYDKKLNTSIKKCQNDMTKLLISKQQLKQVLEAGKQGEFLRRSGGFFGGFGIDDKQYETRVSGDSKTTYYKGIWLKDWQRAIDAIP